MSETLQTEQQAAEALASKAQTLVDKMKEDAYRQGWARGYERGFVAGVEAAGMSKPRVELTDAV